MKSLEYARLLALSFIIAAGLPAQAQSLSEGLYVFDCPIVYKEGMCRLTEEKEGFKVELLENFGGSFEIIPGADQRLKIPKTRLNYDRLKRSFKGSGSILEGAKAEGTGVVWLKNFLFMSRDHRTGPWTLRPATPRDIQKYESKLKRRAKAKK